jgi:succinate dehydrogenase / fumarate reductase cytochrome b subunit
VAIIYVVANVALAIHIFHGTWSLFQSLGINNPKYNELRRTLAKSVAGIILVGNLSFPVLVTVGLIDDDNRKCEVGDVACLEHEAEKH